MTRRIVSTPRQSAPVAINLPIEMTDLTAHQTAQVFGGYVGWPDSLYDVIADYISEEFGIDLPPLPDLDVDVHPWSM